MDTGRIVEQGTFEQLMAKDGDFAHFAHRQMI
jgi:ABC-type multidrug transport system fused ATPase/permease subunit